MVNKTKFTPFQLKAIEARCEEMLVSASAGSGKTTVMIERVISLINEGIDLKNMAIVTFTKASAADMREKLYKRLSALASNGSDLAFKQLRALQSAQISTLHSFCQQLIKSHFYAIETDPDFVVLNETDAKTLLKECIDKEIEDRLKTEDKDFAVVYEVLLQNRKTTILSECIERLFDFSSSQTDFDNWIDNACKSSNNHSEHIEALKNELNIAFALCEERALRLENETARTNFKRNINATKELYDAIRRKERCDSRGYGKLPDDDYLLELNNEFGRIKEDCNSLVDKLNSIENSADPLLAFSYTQVLLDMTKKVKLLYEQKKRKDGVKDYADLEHDALKILKNDEVKKQIDSKYLYLFVDEYQDINPIQESIISHFGAKKFFVGDVKQSIYSFRMCTPEIFSSKRLRLKAEQSNKPLSGMAIELNSNFRSEAEILRFCNEAFSHIMTSDFGDCDYKNDAAFVIEDAQQKDDKRSSEVAATTANPCVELFLVDGKRQEQNVLRDVYSVKEHVEIEDELSLKDGEINLIIDYIANLIDDKESGGGGAEFKDIAILLRSVSGDYAKKLKTALDKMGFPAFLQEKRSALENASISTLVSFLKLIDNHYDDIALVTSLRSPLGGITNDELAEIKSCYKGELKYFYDAINAALLSDELNQELKAKLKVFYGRLERFTNLSYSRNAAQILGDVCSEFDYFKYVFACKDGQIKARELAAFLAFAEESVFKTTVGEFVRALDKEMPKLDIGGDADAIKIMTIHASKGLEFPYVICADLSKSYNMRDLSKPLLLDSELGAALKVWDLKNHTKQSSSLYMRIAQKMKKRLALEEARILYVALTRAKKGLALFARVEDLDKLAIVKPENATSFFELLTPLFIKYSTKYSLKDCSFNSILRAVHIHNKEPNLKLVESIRRYIDFKDTTQTSVPLKSAVTYLAELDIGQADDSSFDASLVGRVNSYAALRGTMVHAFLESVDFDFVDEDNEWQRLNSITNDLDGLVDRRKFFLMVKKIKEFIGKRKYFREKPFVCAFEPHEIFSCSNVSKKSGEHVLIQGVIDLLIKDDDGYIIVDYKSGRIDENMQKYENQLNIYSRALSKILRVKVKEKLIFSLDELKLISI